MSHYLFGEFACFPQRRELLRGGAPVDLEPRVFDLLVLLIRQRDRAVSRQEMADAVWPGMVVTDAAFSQAIARLRRAVDDDGRSQAVIRTATRRGYRFVAAVREIDDATASAAGTTATTRAADALPATPLPSRRRMLWAAAATVLLGLIAFASIREATAPPAPRLAVLPLQVSGSADLAWAELGLMGLLAQRLDRQVDTVRVGAVLSAIGPAREDPAAALAAVQAAYPGATVLAATIDSGGDGARMDYVLHAPGQGPRKGAVQATDPLRAAQRLGDLLALEFGKARTSAPVPMHEELYARGLDATLRGDANAASEYFRIIVREDPTNAWARYELALTDRQLGHLDESAAALGALIAHADAQPEYKLAVGARQALALQHWRAGELEQADALYAQALQIAQHAEVAGVRPGLLLNLGILDSSRGEFDRARRHYLEALDGYRLLQDRAGEARVYNSLGVLAWRRQDAVESEAMHRHALQVRRQLGRDGDIAASLNNLGTLAERDGRWSEARTLYDEAFALREQLGDGSGQASTLVNLASLERWRGEYAQAADFAARGLQAAEQHGVADTAVRALLIGADIALRSGDLAQARALAAAMQERAAARDGAIDDESRRLLLARLAAADGEPERARAELDALLHTASPAGQASARFALARMSVDDDPQREQLLREALDAARAAHEPGLTARSAALLAALLLDRGERDAALALLPEARRWPDAIPTRALESRL